MQLDPTNVVESIPLTVVAEFVGRLGCHPNDVRSVFMEHGRIDLELYRRDDEGHIMVAGEQCVMVKRTVRIDNNREDGDV